MRRDFASTILFSILILVLMIVAPMLIIKSMPAKANSEDIIIPTTDEEDKSIILEGNNVIRVNITKENRIEEVPLEEYVKSVVSGEMPASFSEEALKAQAIAARTYVASKRLRKCDIANGGDVCDTTHCQVYISKESRLENWESNANENWDKISRAVDDTKGIVLTYNSELVLYPQFFSTSSGMTENAADVFSNEVPYLVSTESKGEEIAPKFETEFSLDINEFVNKINDKYPEANMTTDNLEQNIEIISRSEAGSIKEIRLGKTKIRGLDFRLTLGLSSSNFEYIINNNKVTFKCRGYGHGVGMSQWGANVMAKNGSGYNEILKHYYTGVELKNLIFKE
ncbi:stage II sporulation protein D [Clostridium sp. AL.422]|uniref:stage II sporulation protein D n=1 Tax=Clostridium TaxID=1485 RepID=UPI00293DA9E5|nr:MULTISPECIES: stage II sporulation protein D [unclassified Clostridium]MDV4151601.1 stage II sporulation protein D [Clostridium sp. AL.422]